MQSSRLQIHSSKFPVLNSTPGFWDPNSVFWIPSSEFSIPSSEFRILWSRFWVLNSIFQILYSEFQILISKFYFLLSCKNSKLSSTWCDQLIQFPFSHNRLSSKRTDSYSINSANTVLKATCLATTCHHCFRQLSSKHLFHSIPNIQAQQIIFRKWFNFFFRIMFLLLFVV